MPRRVGTLGEELTAPELVILTMLADGHPDKAIAATTRYALDYTKQRIRTLYEKLGARNRAHAVHLGHQGGLLGDGGAASRVVFEPASVGAP